MHGDHPRAVAGGYCHDSAGCKDQLIAIMKMQRDHVPCRVVVGQRDDGSAFGWQAIEHGGLSLIQHYLTQYRMSDSPARSYPERCVSAFAGECA